MSDVSESYEERIKKRDEVFAAAGFAPPMQLGGAFAPPTQVTYCLTCGALVAVMEGDPNPIDMHLAWHKEAN